jgi:glycosyltransferase involved in cell wall biosynthesis
LFCGIAEHASKITSRWEVIFIDDGSSGGSWEVIRQLAFENPNHVAAIKFRRNMGKADALAAGWEECKGDFVFTMDTNLHQHSERAKTKPIVARVGFSNRSSLSRLSGHRLLAGGESSFAWGVLAHDLGVLAEKLRLLSETRALGKVIWTSLRCELGFYSSWWRRGGVVPSKTRINT